MFSIYCIKKVQKNLKQYLEKRHVNQKDLFKLISYNETHFAMSCSRTRDHKVISNMKKI